MSSSRVSSERQPFPKQRGSSLCRSIANTSFGGTSNDRPQRPFDKADGRFKEEDNCCARAVSEILLDDRIFVVEAYNHVYV